jgi:uncharacterized protein YbjQ (UPF0145 family)
MSTTSQLDGFKICKYIGIVNGESLFRSTVFKDLVYAFASLFGKHSRKSKYEKELTRSRQEALSQLVKRSSGYGATAVIGIKIDYQFVGSYVMVCATGTAVFAEKSNRQSHNKENRPDRKSDNTKFIVGG